MNYTTNLRRSCKLVVNFSGDLYHINSVIFIFLFGDLNHQYFYIADVFCFFNSYTIQFFRISLQNH